MTKGNRLPQNLAIVRRFEAAGFRAWPATSVQYDGTWAVRLSGGHPAKRLNSINPLDPFDDANLTERIARAARRFAAYGRPLTFRMSPLAAPAIREHLDAQGWSHFSESLVMRATLSPAMVHEAMHQIPLKDMGRFISAAISIRSLDPALRPGLSEIVSSIQPEAGLFVLEEGRQPVSTAICVHDEDLAGLFEVATEASRRGRGYGRRVLLSALKWAQARGARTAWLQVDADNESAIGLYRSIGFAEVYRYHYRQPPHQDDSA
ncbi:MAG: GNAT family N-acetyltransferase [Aquamicrobium sp.]|uniref:GNAT family N-acetyltransferase n=1 Tax=Aquamicrobium sp. TaxID=1872579 RepID=UPI00349EFF96|nr:GNAT family N-acetyltransferase [Aquamicrobium sp.]MCO5158731.1 GNAT family N-acetyltransferase [Aquamicrobium sp.]